MRSLTNDWLTILAEEIQAPYFQELQQFLNEEYAQQTIYPPQDEVLCALEWTSFADTKVVILGQDPYHGNGQAHGLSFSVKPGTVIPPSLRNMYKELAADLDCPIPDHGYLKTWAEQGVLLLNAVLTVREAQPNSHKGKGWERFTDQIIRALSAREKPVIFVLWGSHAQAKAALIDATRHVILTSAHPSPLSAYRGFFGSKPFTNVNAVLKRLEVTTIDWHIPNM
ncbi:uracil-DNA glycosylase [Paenibacillus qinlingensis]|uniref:Uracil-DNA glycosylase n=1 Tax=Paenibacillus qinlingensis TaxID=1837343 RepID=A0ABU1NQR4_9BACL|nr:uracil-DNA glycosylase [Paenibacillus qinlingensis]MDR6549763.1 uracil-DNA glycosylase [Paenibacillus qinlingensis]